MTLQRLVGAFLLIGSLSALAQGPRDECPRGRRGAQCRERRNQQQRVEKKEEKVEVTQETLLRPNRIDFEGSNLTGQLNRAGGVYLYNRKELATRSMINKPDNFRSEIVNPE